VEIFEPCLAGELIIWARKGQHLGTVEARDEAEAITKAAETFNIGTARRNKIAVMKIDGKGK
jgi:hypothetical protein